MLLAFHHGLVGQRIWRQVSGQLGATAVFMTPEKRRSAREMLAPA
jgi:hypothetical protein